MLFRLPQEDFSAGCLQLQTVFRASALSGGTVWACPALCLVPRAMRRPSRAHRTWFVWVNEVVGYKWVVCGLEVKGDCWSSDLTA